MAIKFASSEMGAFKITNNPTGVDEALSQPGNPVDLDYARTAGGVRLTAGGTIAVSLVSAMTSGWVHHNFYLDGSSGFAVTSSVAFMTLADASGNPGILLNTTGFLNGNYEVRFYGTSGVVPLETVGSGTLFSTNQNLNIWDIAWKVNASIGYVKFYSGGNLQAQFTGDTSNFSGGVSKISWRPTNRAHKISEVIIDDEPTIGDRLFTNEPVSDASVAEFIGSVQNINSTSVNDNAGIYTSVIGATHTFTPRQLTAPANQAVVKAVVITARARRDSNAAPGNIENVLRIGGSVYGAVSAGTISIDTQTSLDVGFQPYVGVFDTNPATGLAWTVSDVSTIQGFGVRALA